MGCRVPNPQTKLDVPSPSNNKYSIESSSIAKVIAWQPSYSVYSLITHYSQDK